MNLVKQGWQEGGENLWINKTADEHYFPEGTSLSDEQLDECICNYRKIQILCEGKFHAALDQINSEAIRKIESEQFEQALDRLEDGEKILNHAVQSGKTISKALILTILHNETCAYQGIYNLASQSSYLQALMQNLQSSLAKIEEVKGVDSDSFLQNDCRNYQVLSNYVKYKKDYALYQLQYAALISKTYQHQQAIKYVHESIKLIKDVFHLCYRYEGEKQKMEDRKNQQRQTLLNLSKINGCLKLTAYEKYLRSVRKYLHAGFPEGYQKKTLEAIVEDFSLGKIMQIRPKTLQEAQSINDLDHECGEVGKIKKIFYLAACYFTIGTEYRLIASKSQSKSNRFRSSNEFLLSQVYHLYCILLILKYVPCPSPFLTHLLTSFKNHYCTDLYQYDEKQENLSTKDNIDQSDEESLNDVLPPNQQHNKSQKNKNRLYTSYAYDYSSGLSYDLMKSPPAKRYTPEKIIETKDFLDNDILDPPNLGSKHHFKSNKSLNKKGSSLTSKKPKIYLEKKQKLKKETKQQENPGNVYQLLNTKKKSKKGKSIQHLQNLQTIKKNSKKSQQKQKVAVKDLIGKSKEKKKIKYKQNGGNELNLHISPEKPFIFPLTEREKGGLRKSRQKKGFQVKKRKNCK